MTLVRMLISILSSVSLHLNKLIKLVSESFSKALERKLQREKFLRSSQDQGKSGYKVSCREATHGAGSTSRGRTKQVRCWAGERWPAVRRRHGESLTFLKVYFASFPFFTPVAHLTISSPSGIPEFFPQNANWSQPIQRRLHSRPSTL